MELIVESPLQLLPLRTRAARRHVSRVVLAFARGDADERAINRGLRACGCDVGSIFMLASIASMLIAVAFGWRTSWWMAIAAVFAATLLGKITGLVYAEWRLRTTIDRLAGVKEA